MEYHNIKSYSKSDSSYLIQIGDFIRAERIAQKRTQSELAESSGVNRGTIVQLEKGNSVNLLSLIQILRALRKLNVLHEMEYTPRVSPLQMAAEEQKKIKRVRHKKPHNTQKSSW